MLMRRLKSKIGENFVQRSFPPSPLQDTLMFVFCPFSVRKTDKNVTEKFLERGLGRNPFTKGVSPDYFFESESVSLCIGIIE